MKHLLRSFLLLILLIPAVQAQDSEKLTLKDIFHEPFIPGNRPSFSHFSPAGNTIYFWWADSLVANTKLYQVGLSGKNQKEAPKDLVRGFTLSPQGDKVIYSKNGNLVLADINFENERVIVDSKGRDYSPVWKADGTAFAFIQDGDIWIAGVEQPYIKQVTKRGKDEPAYFISGWADDEYLVLRQTDNSNAKEYYFPEYVGHYVETGATRRGIPTQIITLAEIESGKITELLKREGYARSEISSDGKYVAIDWQDGAQKKREIQVFSVPDKTPVTVFTDQTEGWLYGTDIAFAPAGNKLMFQSERDGWNHIYTVNPDGSGMKQHTFGQYDIPWAVWIDENTMVYASSEKDPGEVHLMRLDLNTNLPTKLTIAEGHRRDFRLSPDRRRVVYAKTFFNEPADLYVIDIAIPQREIRLTNSVPEVFNNYSWQVPDYVRFTGRDGSTSLSMTVLKPEKRNPAGNPVVVFVHGAGSLQNVFKGWSFSYWREYLFHQFLTQQGYYVIEVDYRHSTGYGRKFREDVTNWMGRYETEDIEDGLAFLADNYDKADTSRVGIYGGSYGGFMALYAVSVSPDKFDAAAALRAVTNWENYYHTNPWYTYPRLGSPYTDSLNYARSSPLTYADSLKKPVLILHGLIDNNVGFQDAAQYIERLIQSGNEQFEMMMYPSERHSFVDDDAWYDEYRRIFRFFEQELKQ